MREFDLSWVIPLDPYGHFTQVISALQNEQQLSDSDVSLLTLQSFEHLIQKIESHSRNEDSTSTDSWQAWHSKLSAI